MYAVQECRTVFPGESPNYMYYSDVMKEYFRHVIEAEKHFFGDIKFLPSNVYQLPVENGDLSKLNLSILEPALNSDVYVVMGASYIRGPLMDFLATKSTLNIHMGVSPYFRGSATNFWAAFDGHPEMIGATIHYLDKGLDTGNVLYHALPKPEYEDTFMVGMHAVKAAEESLVARISDGSIFKMKEAKQDRSQQIRYSKRSDFTDEVARKYMETLMAPKDVEARLRNRQLDMFINPLVI